MLALAGVAVDDGESRVPRVRVLGLRPHFRFVSTISSLYLSLSLSLANLENV